MRARSTPASLGVLIACSWFVAIACFGCGDSRESTPPPNDDGVPVRDDAIGTPVATFTAAISDIHDLAVFGAPVPAPLKNQTIRQIAHVSLGGERVRLKF